MEDNKMQVNKKKIKAMCEGRRVLWQVSVCSEGRNSSHYVVTSAASPVDWSNKRRPETFAFRSDSEGGIMLWRELPGSITGEINHDLVICGYCEAIKNNRVDIAEDTAKMLEDKGNAHAR